MSSAQILPKMTVSPKGLINEILIDQLKEALTDEDNREQLPTIDMCTPQGNRQIEMLTASIDYNYDVRINYRELKGGSDEYGNFEELREIESVDWGIQITDIWNDNHDPIKISYELKTELETIITNDLETTY